MKKCFKVILIMLVFVMASVNVAMASSGNAPVNVELTPSTTNIEVGKTFTVVLSQECSDGIISVDSKLEYNENIFELTNIAMGEGWTNYGDGNVITAMSNEDITSGEVVTLTFKALAESTGKITIKNIKAYKDYNDIVDVEDKVVEITVGNGQVEVPVNLTEISITKGPTKTEYTVGEKFNSAGMEVSAKYSDGTTKTVTNYTYSPNGELKTSDTKVTISFTEGGITRTTEQKITVKQESNAQSSNNQNTTNTNTMENTVQNTAANNTAQNATTNNTAQNTVKNTTTVTSAKNKTTNTKSDNTTAQQSNLPKTGSRAMFVLAAGVGLIGISALSYIGYKKYKEI